MSVANHRPQCNRRAFLRLGAALAAGAPLAGLSRAFGQQGVLSSDARSKATVAIVPCKTYGPEVKAGLRQCFDLVGGVKNLVGNKTVTVKLNLTGTDFTRFLGKPVGETFMTHSATVSALLALLFDAGAARVRLV